MLKPTREIRAVALGVVLVLLVLGCEEEPPDLEISQFDRPQDVALVCFDNGNRKTLPLECCKKRETVSLETCGSALSVGRLYAFVTQTTPGEVAVVDVEEQSIVDQDDRIPYNSFIPVGGQPSDIAATDDGKHVYTANYETGDISVITVMDERTGHSVIDRPRLTPATSIDMHGPVARMIVVAAPKQYKDRFAFATQPTLGRLAVLALDSRDCPDPVASAQGCFLGYLQLSTIRQDTGEAEQQPWAIAASDGQSVYVGSYNGEVIWDIQSESLIAAALAVSTTTPAEVSSENVLNDTIPISPYRTRVLSLEPERKRWIYAVEEDRGGVIAINLDSRVPHSKKQPDIIEVEVPGRARAVALVELQERDEPGPFSFNGTFAVVSTTTAGIAVIDVDDGNAGLGFSYPHEMRSAVDLTTDAGMPQVSDDLKLLVDGEEVEPENIGEYLYFDTEELQDAGCDAGEGYRPDYDDGVRLQCNPRESKAEKWVLTWQGLVGISGVGTIVNIQDRGQGPWQLLSEDWDRDFCKQELYTPGSREGYPGDLVVVTSDPTPNKGSEQFCKEHYNEDSEELVFRVVGVSRYFTDDEESPANVIEFVSEGEPAATLLAECFGQALGYEIRSDDQWILKGTASSYRRTQGKLPQAQRSCVYDEDKPSKMRVYPGERLENGFLTFTMRYGEAWADTGPEHIIEEGDDEEELEEDPQVTLSFEITGGYVPMFRVVPGNNITDIQFTPDNELLLVDQDGEGLILFDMLDNFTTIGEPVN